jgi:PRTRC genetic system protein B
MNKELVNKKMFPERAILVYKTKDTYSPSYYLESRSLVEKNGRYLLLAPVALGDNVLKSIAKAYTKANTVDIDFAGPIPEYLLYAVNNPGFTAVVWFRPAMVRLLNFSAQLKISKADAIVNIPALLFALVNTTLYIYALDSDKRPDTKTKLYNAPFFNIYEDGNVCLGTAKIGNRTKSYEGEVERFERAFFMADQNGGMFNKQCKTPLHKLWNDLSKNKTPFPSNLELIQHKKTKTVGQLFNSIIGIKGGDDE